MDLKNVDISKLSRKEKEDLLDLIREKKRRDREERDVFSPHAGQLKVLQSTAKEKFAFCGNGWGKSAVIANWIYTRAKGHDPWRDEYIPAPNRTVLVLDNPSKVEDQFLPELNKWVNVKVDWLEKRGKPFYNKINWPNGSETLIMFHNQDPLLFESIELDNLALDEPPPRKVFNGLRRGMRKAGSKPELLLVGTPITQAWLRKEILEPWSRGELKDVEVFYGKTDDNKANLNWEQMEHYFGSLTEKEREVRRSGMFFDLEGLALAHLFDEDTHLVKPFEVPNNWPCAIAIDPHPSKKHHAILLAGNGKGQIYAVKELASKLPPREFARQLKKWSAGFKLIDIVCDSLGSTPTSGGDGNKSFIQVLNEEGVRARATSFRDKNDEEFIQRIQQVLEIPQSTDNFGNKTPKLLIFDTLKGLISDIRNVEWQKHKNYDENKQRLDITDKDYLSCLKYGLTCNIGSRVHRAKKRSLARRPSPWSGR